jgi:hypothetical protein
MTVSTPPELPAAERVSDWLGAPVGALQPRPSAFFRRHVLFTASAGRDVLPFVSLPAGSWGVVAFDGSELTLLSPADDAFERLLRREARPLDEASPMELAQLLCDARLPRPSSHRHAVVSTPADVESFGGGRLGRFGGYRVAAAELRRAGPSIEPPAISALDQGGWSITFTTLTGWMHELDNLGLESIWVEPDFTLTIGDRRVLSDRIFERMPGVRY